MLRNSSFSSNKSRRSLLKTMTGLPALIPAFAAPTSNPRLFAMDTAMVTKYSTPLKRSDLAVVADLGYSGIAPDVSGEQSLAYVVHEVAPLLDEYHLKLAAVFCQIGVGRDQFEVPPEIPALLPALKRYGTTLWVSTVSLLGPAKPLEASDPAGDRMAVAAIRQIAGEAATSGCSVSLYPHFGNVIQTVEDAVSVCNQVDRKNVSVTFNLCHYLRSEPDTPLRRVLETAQPHLSLVTTCGADTNGKNWAQLIQPLDSGTFKQETLLAELNRIGYRGPIGLQGYDVSKNYHIEPSENLRRSMAAWKKLMSANARLS